MTTVDHLVFATPDVDIAVGDLVGRLGVAASAGGQHPGRGTRNALVGLGPRTYLEVVGPDAGQRHAGPRWFRVGELTRSKLVAWAVATNDLDGIAARASEHGVALGPIVAGRRRRPDGVELSWRCTDPGVLVEDGIVPFFIDWGESPHPASSLPSGLILLGLRAEHPSVDRVRASLEAVGIDLPVARGRAPRLIATIETRYGVVELA